MSSIRLATASNVRGFQSLSNALSTSDGRWADSIDHEALGDEFGRFRVWSGNLGALQKGHSSLDYRLRDSPLLSDNTLKFLKELEDNLNEAFAVVSGARLPYESQQVPVTSEEDEEEDDFFSDDDDDTSNSSKTELDMRFGEIVDIIDNLYKLSVRIRTPTIRSRSLKAASYQPKDPETGIDILRMYADYDCRHTKELLYHLRKQHGVVSQDEDDFLAVRLSKSITLRRRHFMYWKRHRDKLAISTIPEESFAVVQPTTERPELVERNVTAETYLNPDIVIKEAPSQKTGKTMLSGTEATHHNQSLDNLLDTKSVTSYAVTVKDIHGKGIDLPPPPKGADGERDFECPYCYIICPARYGSGRPWRTHLLQDLQPYVCTYVDCEASEQLFRSRREWVEHEATHRKAWRCPEHLNAVYGSRTGLEDHLRQEHADSIPTSQLEAIINIGETSTVDVRDKCPICFASAGTEGMGDFQNHVANHLERFATFALPNGNEEDADGASSAASRGRSGSSDSQDVREMPLPSDASDHEEETEELIVQEEDDRPVPATKSLLSADSLSSLPDVSGNRLAALLAQSQLEDHNEAEEQKADPALEPHVERTERLKAYLISLGAESVRFFRRYDWWRGDATFPDKKIASQALESFDRNLYPRMKIRQGTNVNKNKLKFSGRNTENTDMPPPTRQSTVDTRGTDDVSGDSESTTHEEQEQKGREIPVLTLPEIPTLRELYRSRKLLQRDQSFAPNDSYNRIISFCYYDLTKLAVEAIVNSANTSLTKSKLSSTLNYAIHKAAGPGLTKEAMSQKKIKSGEAVLTGGYLLPSAHVIHVARPTYHGALGMAHMDMLTKCYHSALEIALEQGFKSVAFPCLGTGGCGFPEKMAARVALQEVRDFLDKHPEHPFERIVFTVNTAVDDDAYMSFFPVFFPPTHGDLETARASKWSAELSALSAQVYGARAQIQKIVNELLTDFSPYVSDFPDEVFRELRGIDSSLTSIRGFLIVSKELERSPEDLQLTCAVIQTVCDSISEFIEQAKDSVSRGEMRHKEIWTDYNAHMDLDHETDLAHFLAACQDFVQCIDDILTRNGVELDEMAAMRQKLESFKAKQKNQDVERIRDHLDEVSRVRSSQRETVSPKQAIVRLHQIPTVHELYQQNQLEEKPTMARPFVAFNNIVSLVREDITKLEVTIMVNSTNILFSGSGTLDHLVFQKGGAELRQECRNFGPCKEGDVKITPGYLLPAKHIFHVIPPDQYKKESKNILRKIYREILYTAASMRATSIAIPSIGTGMLNYPRRDCASIAMEEVKRYLETAEPSSTLESIVLVVYSSSDEFVYKSLLPMYFPPVKTEHGSTTRPAKPVRTNTSSSSVSESTSPPRRSLFGSIGDALRNMGSARSSAKRPASHILSPVDSYEEKTLIEFESHARDCLVCKDMDQLYMEGRGLCADGDSLAQTTMWYMFMSPDQHVYREPAQIKPNTRLEVPEDMFPQSLKMLSLAERSLREERKKPFVTPNRRHHAKVQSQDQQEPLTFDKKSEISNTTAMEQSRVHIRIWSSTDKIWLPLFPGDCDVLIQPGKIGVYKPHVPSSMQEPLLSLELTEMRGVAKFDKQPGLVIDGAFHLPLDQDTGEKIDGRILLLSQDVSKSQSLLEMLHRAHPAIAASLQDLDTVTSSAAGGNFADHRDMLSSRKAEDWTAPSSKPVHQNAQSDEEKTNTTGTQPRDRFRALLSRIQNRSQAASEVGPSSSQSSSKAPLSPSANEVLSHMMANLKSRLDSPSIGQTTNAIASSLQKSPTDTLAALQELEVKGYVYMADDRNTWVVSNPTQEIPVVVEETKIRRERSRRSIGTLMRESRAGASDKDRHQANLDRVLAGDMKEEELGHFTDDVR